jgi:hypothetical protein
VEANVFTRVVLLLVLVLVPRDLLAQSATVPLPQWDVTGTVGLFAGHRPRIGTGTGYQELWFHVVQGGAIVGRHLNRHLKIEIEASGTNGGTQFREQQIEVAGFPYPFSIGSHVTTSVRSVGALLTWQFRDNEWVHPFLQAGIAADFDRVTVRTWEQFTYGLPGVPPRRVVEARVDGPTTTREARAVLGGGTKLYLSQRAFVRADGRWTVGRERHDIATRIGIGIDF